MDELISVPNVTFETLLQLPSELIDDAAIGLIPIAELFEAHGYDPETAVRFSNSAIFNRLVNKRAIELEKKGVTHKARAAFVAGDTLTAIANRVRDPEVSSTFLMDVYKETTKTGALIPRSQDESANVPRFSIKINIPAAGAPAPRAAINMKTISDDPEDDAFAEFEVV